MDLIEQYYNKIRVFRMAQNFLTDIDNVGFAVKNLTYNSAYKIISYCTNKYKKELNLLGELLSGMIVCSPDDLPDRQESNMLEELKYIQRAIVVFAVLHCGLERSMFDVVKKIKKYNADNDLPISAL